MFVVGIDPGTARTGYGFVRMNADGSLTAVDYGVVETKASVSMPERLETLFQSIGKLINLHQPVSGAVEKVFFQKNVSTAMTVGQARGVVLLSLAQSGVSVGEYSPSEIKQAVCGYGQAGKRQMQEMVKILLSLDETPTPDDAADALAVAICHLHTMQVANRWLEDQ